MFGGDGTTPEENPKSRRKTSKEKRKKSKEKNDDDAEEKGEKTSYFAGVKGVIDRARRSLSRSDKNRERQSNMEEEEDEQADSPNFQGGAKKRGRSKTEHKKEDRGEPNKKKKGGKKDIDVNYVVVDENDEPIEDVESAIRSSVSKGRREKRGERPEKRGR